MKKNLHPEYHELTVTCITCNTQFLTNSTANEIKVDVCSNCHAFYAGKSNVASAAGRVERFNKKYNK